MNDPVNYVDLWGLCGSDGKKLNLNTEFANILVKYFLDKPYVLGGTSVNNVDCSGLLIASLRMMGFAVDRETTATLSSGNVDWISISSQLVSEGELGILNFYSMGGGKTINHMSIGIGYTNIPPEIEEPVEQLINANEDASLLVRNDGRSNQYFEANATSVNQTYAPLSSNTPAILQATINWDVLMKSYFDYSLAQKGYWGNSL